MCQLFNSKCSSAVYNKVDACTSKLVINPVVSDQVIEFASCDACRYYYWNEVTGKVQWDDPGEQFNTCTALSTASANELFDSLKLHHGQVTAATSSSVQLKAKVTQAVGDVPYEEDDGARYWFKDGEKVENNPPVVSATAICSWAC